jgi:hypothetical protein
MTVTTMLPRNSTDPTRAALAAAIAEASRTRDAMAKQQEAIDRAKRS